MLIKSKILAKEGKMSVAQNALEHQFNVSQSSSLVSVVTDDDDIFMGIAGKMRSSFCQAIGQKNKIIAFYSPNELVQRKYLFKLITKINSRLNDEIINLHPSWATNVKLAFERKNSVQIIVSVPLSFDRNSVIFDTKNCDEVLKKYFIKMLGAKHENLAHFSRFIIQDTKQLEALQDLLAFKEHLRYIINFEFDRGEYESFCEMIYKLNSKGYKMRFNALASLLEEHFATLECSVGDDFNTVRAQYLRLSKLYHPDHASGNEQELGSKFQEISFAYETLKPFFVEEDKYLKGRA